MPAYVALLRGINVGGRNLIGMPALAECFRDAGYRGVRTYIQSGNVLFTADAGAADAVRGAGLEDAVERMLTERFEIPILVIIRSRDEFAAIIAAAPANHGSAELRSDAYFLKAPLDADATFADLPELREGVDSVALGPGVIYFSRVAALAGKTRITRLMRMPMFTQMTVRNWRTTTKLLALLDENEPAHP
ncbi:DUF1697 domain-containing protein [Cryobacterium melibiosiphilum]|uniref:DUF1697 domain-containing protein n=1 Tax=Cryobacterium melibiosiphilum TaxID=995039 RepID=A0A3A5MGQ1_9MICO|nr:DUF1697 domain-containing protein [Cryobacterium melibiosiphilum]RJT88031.1 DUF1697 domain-containing protein [Cryobacterium melibiosiphilum]